MSKRTGNDGTVGDTIADADCKKEKGMAEWPFPYKYRVFGLFAEDYICGCNGSLTIFTTSGSDVSVCIPHSIAGDIF